MPYRVKASPRREQQPLTLFAVDEALARLKHPHQNNTSCEMDHVMPNNPRLCRLNLWAASSARRPRRFLCRDDEQPAIHRRSVTVQIQRQSVTHASSWEAHAQPAGLGLVLAPYPSSIFSACPAVCTKLQVVRLPSCFRVRPRPSAHTWRTVNLHSGA